MAKTHTFHVHGMHCASCVMMIEDRVSDAAGVSKAKAHLRDATLVVETDLEDDPVTLARDFTALVRDRGYSIELEKAGFKPRWEDFRIALPAALAFVAAFIVLQKTGLVNLVNSDQVSLPIAFVIGIIASLSSCLAVVGGLLLSISANYAKEDGHKAPQAMFHVGRLVAFFALGGVIGAIGAAFTLSMGVSIALNVLIGAIMLALGLNLLDVFPWAKRFQPRMPKFLAKSAVRTHSMNHSLAPALIGVSTFFLPCGFTQSMQFYTLSTGGFLPGALTMGAYALGTLPVLALISFTAQKFGTGSSTKTSVFFKTAGLLVIAFALLNIANGMVVAGIIPPFLNI